jgi:hypothetical protein
VIAPGITSPANLCATCAFFDKLQGSPVGICRFLPPTASGIPMQKPGLDGKIHIEIQQVNMWANTRPDDWCAQHIVHPDYAPTSH